MTPEEYKARIEEKRARLEERAEKLRAEAASRERAARRISDGIPLGQPILVGHHSERRHRRDLGRMQADYQKSWEASKEASRLESRAESLGTNGISSDDPEAVCKLKQKLAKLENERDAIKAHNKAAKKSGAETIPGWRLSNLGAEIRRCKARIEELSVAAERPEAEPVVGEGFQIEEDASDNRIRVHFDAKPAPEVCAKMKSLGFRWAPSVGAWQRMLNASGRAAARAVAEYLSGGAK